jgi:hypothetical protein
MPDGPGALPSLSLSTVSSISPSFGTLSSTSKGATNIGIGSPGGLARVYNTLYSATNFYMSAWAGFDPFPLEFLYQP